MATVYTARNLELYHHGVMGMKWGVRRYQPYPKGYSGDGKYLGKAKTPGHFAKKYGVREARQIQQQIEWDKYNTGVSKKRAQYERGEIDKQEYKQSKRELKAERKAAIKRTKGREFKNEAIESAGAPTRRGIVRTYEDRAEAALTPEANKLRKTAHEMNKILDTSIKVVNSVSGGYAAGAPVLAVLSGFGIAGASLAVPVAAATAAGAGIGLAMAAADSKFRRYLTNRSDTIKEMLPSLVTAQMYH